MNDNERLDIDRLAEGIKNTADRAKVAPDTIHDAAQGIVKDGYDLGHGIVRGWHHANPDAAQSVPRHVVERIVEQAKESLGRSISNGIEDAGNSEAQP